MQHKETECCAKIIGTSTENPSRKKEFVAGSTEYNSILQYLLWDSLNSATKITLLVAPIQIPYTEQTHQVQLSNPHTKSTGMHYRFYAKDEKKEFKEVEIAGPKNGSYEAILKR